MQVEAFQGRARRDRHHCCRSSPDSWAAPTGRESDDDWLWDDYSDCSVWGALYGVGSRTLAGLALKSPGVVAFTG